MEVTWLLGVFRGSYDPQKISRFPLLLRQVRVPEVTAQNRPDCPWGADAQKHQEHPEVGVQALLLYGLRFRV